MKTATFWIATLAIFGVVNALIASKERSIRTGTTMYLELAPVDPRLLMQGDYMALRYAIGRTAVGQGHRPPHHGQLVVRLDEKQVGHFVRFHRGEPLAEREHLLRYRLRNGEPEIGPGAFFFQEGHAQHYAQAQYGELKVGETGESVLVTLRNADFSLAGSPSSVNIAK